MALRFFNSLSRKVEDFSPIKKNGAVGIYTCGPTVYGPLHIGNWRTYILSDVVRRTLEHFQYKTSSVMNITDVGHLTDDADQGEDKLDKTAKATRKNAYEVAEIYGKDFLSEMEKLNISKPKHIAKATEHIPEQIQLIQKLEAKNFTYRTEDGIYFDTVSFENAGFKYGELSNLTEIKEGARVSKNTNKKNPRDFALWKFSPKEPKRDMEWESPWGIGFPGWHIECSAMSMKYLGEQFDIHIGGEDLKSTHHPNEIAQSEGATGSRPFVKYWLHGAFVQMNGGKMAKSLGTGITLKDLKNKKIHPLSFRYFVLGTHYRNPLNFTWEAISSAQSAFEKIILQTVFYPESDESDSEIRKELQEKISDDLNTSEVLAILQKAKSKKSIKEIDSILGLSILELSKQVQEIPEDIRSRFSERNTLRADKKWQEADKIREIIENSGYKILDSEKKSLVLRALSLLTD